MSRSGYSTNLDNWDLIRWRGQVASATRGKRGQALLREMLAALDAMPEKRLVTDALVDDGGGVCALGALGQARGLDMKGLDACEPEDVAKAFGVAKPLAAEIMYMNDDPDWGYLLDDRTPEGKRRLDEKRWQQMRDWVAEQITGPK
jgi:hypothetical protein